MITINATISNVGTSTSIKRTPVVTRVQSGVEYSFVNSLNEVKELISTNKYSIFVNPTKGEREKGMLVGKRCNSYKEAVEFIANNPDKGLKVDLVEKNRKYSSEELTRIANELDF